MKIGFNARLLSAPTVRGWNRYTVNIVSELVLAGTEVVLYSDRPIHPEHLRRMGVSELNTRIAPLGMRYIKWEQLWLPRQCEKDRVDVLHCPLNFGLPWSSPCARVLTLHDAIDQAYSGPRMRWPERFAPGAIASALYHWIARNCAERIVTVSRHAAMDLVRVLGIPASKIEVIYEAADERFFQPLDPGRRLHVLQAHGLLNPFVFYVGGWEERKNVPFLVHAFASARLDGVDLVLAGGRDDERSAMKRTAEDLGIADRVRLLGWVDDEDLPALYASALCFVYPSKYEGFGLQLCEAMACGCPVLAANATSLPEILGDGGVLIGINDHHELCDRLRRLITEEGFRDTLRGKAASRARAFSWKLAAQETATTYARLVTQQAILPARVNQGEWTSSDKVRLESGRRSA